MSEKNVANLADQKNMLGMKGLMSRQVVRQLADQVEVNLAEQVVSYRSVR